MDQKLEWIETAALENLRGHLQAIDQLSSQSATTLTVLLAAVGGAFSFAMTTSTLAVPALVLTGFLCVLGLVLVTTCLMIKDAPAIMNEPRNLLQDALTIDQIRRAEIDNIQERIDAAARRNARTARWLNIVRIAAIASPLVFVATAWVAGEAALFSQVAAAGS